MLYRIGTSPTIPATGTDDHVLAPGGDIGRTAEASDTAGADDVYVASDQYFSKPSQDNSFYVKNASTNGSVLKAPGSDSNSVNNLFSAAAIAMATTNTHSGIYLATLLRRHGLLAPSLARGVSDCSEDPDSSPASDVAISAGPDGRSGSRRTTIPPTTSRRANDTADTAFGPVETCCDAVPRGRTPRAQQRILRTARRRAAVVDSSQLLALRTTSPSRWLASRSGRLRQSSRTPSPTRSSSR